MSTSIEWAQNPDGTPGETWNPTRGCLKISPGCKHCYAETFAERWTGTPGHPYELGFKPRLVPEALAKPLGWKKPRGVFVNSMSDLFLEQFPDDYIAACFGMMAVCHWHRFLILTKRAARMARWFEWVKKKAAIEGTHPKDICTAAAIEATDKTSGVWGRAIGASLHPAWPLPNVWLGVSVEDQQRADERIPDLLRVPAAVRFLSCEPLLGPVDIEKVAISCPPGGSIGWVIVGGESGAGARPFDLSWARSIVEQCKAASVPCFFKQAGARPVDDLIPLRGLRDRKGGDLAELPGEWPREFPEVQRG